MASTSRNIISTENAIMSIKRAFNSGYIRQQEANRATDASRAVRRGRVSDHPGATNTLGQKGGLLGYSTGYFKKELAPIYPLFLMVGTGLGLAGWTAGRQLFMAPETYVTKDRRSEVPQLTDPEAALKQANRYVETSFFRVLSHSGGPLRDSVESVVTPYVSSKLPGDDDAVVGAKGGKGAGKPSFGGYGG